MANRLSACWEILSNSASTRVKVTPVHKLLPVPVSHLKSQNTRAFQPPSSCHGFCYPYAAYFSAVCYLPYLYLPVSSPAKRPLCPAIGFCHQHTTCHLCAGLSIVSMATFCFLPNVCRSIAGDDQFEYARARSSAWSQRSKHAREMSSEPGALNGLRFRIRSHDSQDSQDDVKHASLAANLDFLITSSLAKRRS